MFQHLYGKNKNSGPASPLAHQGGQALITSVIVIGVIALLVASSLMILSLGSLRSTVSAQKSSEAIALNNACAEEGLYRLKQTSTYTGSGQVTLSANTCSFTVANDGAQKLITISSIIGKITKKTEVRLTVTQQGIITIVSWQDVP